VKAELEDAFRLRAEPARAGRDNRKETSRRHPRELGVDTDERLGHVAPVGDDEA
jgi:hypothetical protein